MINKIGSIPSFTSKVFLVDDDYCGTYSYNMAAEGSGFDKKILKQVIKKLENNGNDDIVTLKTLTQYEPEDDKYLVQVKEMRGDTAYIGFQLASVFSVKAVLDTYKQAKSDMVEAASGELANYVI